MPEAMTELWKRSEEEVIMRAEESERAVRKKAIFDTMSKRGQERILKIGYDNWDPFQEPKDPRERIFGTSALTAGALLREFLQARSGEEVSTVLYKDLFELCKGLLDGDSRSLMIDEFCHWHRARKESPSQ
jgi:hypothetical protein